jgi:hypothetical protein
MPGDGAGLMPGGGVVGGGVGSGVGGGVGSGGGVVVGQKFVYVAGLNDHIPAAVKSFGPRLFVVEWHAEQEPTSGTVGFGAHAAATLLAMLLVANALCTGIINSKSTPHK